MRQIVDLLGSLGMHRVLLAALIVAALLPGQIRISTTALQATLDPKIGYGMAELRDSRANRDFIAPATKLPLSALRFHARMARRSISIPRQPCR